MSQRTFSATPADIKREWHLVDASNLVLGRIATQIATLLKGKHKAIYTPSIDTGDHVVVVNAEQIRVTGTKEQDKMYYRHALAGFPGGLKSSNLSDLRARHPEDILLNAVRRMLPRNALGRQMMTKLKVYAGPSHPHTAQQPKAFEPKA